jgi:hypothetical protein
MSPPFCSDLFCASIEATAALRSLEVPRRAPVSSPWAPDAPSDAR